MDKLRLLAKKRDRAYRFYKICLMPPVKLDYISELVIASALKN